MRVFVIAVVVVSVILLLSGISDSKKSHSDRKKRSDVANPTIRDKSNDNEFVKHDKPKYKKRLSNDDINADVFNSDEKNHKHSKLCHNKKHEENVIASGKEEKMKMGDKYKSEKNREKCGKCKKDRGQKNSVLYTDNIHNNDDEITSSGGSKSPSSTMNHKNQHKKKRDNRDIEADEISVKNYDSKKQNKHNKTDENGKKSKYEDKKKYMSKHETLSDIDTDTDPDTKHSDKKYSTVKKSVENGKSKKTEKKKSKRDEENEEKEENDKPVLEKNSSKKRIVKSSNNKNPPNDKVAENLERQTPEVCVNEHANDNQDLSNNESCEI